MNLIIEFFTKGINFFTERGVSVGLAWAYVIVTILLLVMAAVALVMWIIVAVKYYKTNRKKLESGKNSFDMANLMLQKAGLKDVQVKKAGFLRAWIYGNYYDLGRKTIYLRKNISNKDTITAVGMALQKVGVAQLCESGDKKAITRYRMLKLGIFGPFIFLPLIIVGSLVDIIILQSTTFTISIICLALGGILLLSSFIHTLLTIPVEKKANEMALEMIEKTNVMTSEEKDLIKKVFDTYIIAYIMDFIVTVLRIIQFILEILVNSKMSSSN